MGFKQIQRSLMSAESIRRGVYQLGTYDFANLLEMVEDTLG